MFATMLLAHCCIRVVVMGEILALTCSLLLCTLPVHRHGATKAEASLSA